MKTISFRIADDLGDLLQQEADKQERSKSFLINKALESYFNNLPQQRSAEECYKKCQSQGKKTFTLEEIKEALGI